MRALRRGQPPGEQNPRAKLTEADVQAIRQRLAAGDKQEAIAKDFGIDRSQVSGIKTGRTWKHNGTPIHTPRQRGSLKISAKLTEADIPTIIQRIQKGESVSAVARAYGVGRTTISDIWHGRRWTHVERPRLERKKVYEDIY